MNAIAKDTFRKKFPPDIFHDSQEYPDETTLLDMLQHDQSMVHCLVNKAKIKPNILPGDITRI